MGTEQSTLSGEFSDNNNPSIIINMKFKEVVDRELVYVTSNSTQNTKTSTDELNTVKKTIVGTCDFCGGTFTDLITHLRIHYYEKPFLCRLCNMSFKTEEELGSHKDSCEEQKRSLFPCSVCLSLGCTNPDHSRNIPNNSTQTQTQIQTQTKLQTHTQTKSQSQTQPRLSSRKPVQDFQCKSYTCFACKRSFALYKQWQIHCNFCKSHSRFYKCPICKKCFGLLIMSRLHQIHCKKALMDDYSCDHCNEKLDNKLDLVTHVLQKHRQTTRITLESLLEESKQLKKEADMLKKNQKPVATGSILKKNLMTKKY